MANVRKRISELNPLTSASLDTTIVGVDNGTTYKIELDVLADAVTSRVNTLDRERLSSLESATSSFETKGRSVISGSSQLTASYDHRYVLSGSITQTNWDNIANKPSGIVSQSTDLSSLNSFTASYFTDSSSFDTKITTEKNRIDAILSASNVNTDTFAEVVSLINSVDLDNDNAFATFYTASNNRLTSLENSTGSFLTSLNGAISSSSQLTNSFDDRYVLSGSIIQTTWDNIASKPVGIVSSSVQVLGGSGVVSGSYETTGKSIVSGSSQLTASYDGRYSLSGSVLTSFSSSIDMRLDTLEATIISGSPNYVQKLGTRVTGVTSTGVTIISETITTTGNPVQIMVTGDANPIGGTAWSRLQIFRDGNAIGGVVQVENTSNLNVPYCLNVIDTPSAGTYTYSMRTVSGHSGTFDFGEHTGPVLTAVELRTNTNLPSTNNTFTGNNTFNGITRFETVGGDEGGEIQFGIPQTNTTLQNRVTTDVWQNRLRIFEGSNDAKGVYIDLSKAPAGNSGEIMWKASGLVNKGVDVTLGNLKARIAATGNASLQLSTVSGTYSIHGSGVYSQASSIAGVTLSTQLSVTTTPTYIVAGYNFSIAGATDTWNIYDTNLGIAWRITMIVGFGFNNNFISIERLH